MLNEKKTYNVHRIYLFIKKIALYSPFNMFISYLWLLTELNTFAVISYIEVRLLMLVHSEKKKKGGGVCVMFFCFRADFADIRKNWLNSFVWYKDTHC